MQGVIALLAQLVIDASFSWLRMFIALFFSIIISIGIGIWAARSKAAGRIIIPILDVLQTLPILAFFPFVIYVVVATLPNYIGINAAVIILIITSMIWNIAFAVYESISTLPNNLLEVASLYKMGRFERLRKVYIPQCMPRVAEQSVLSWAIGLFYLVTSEIFSTGSANYAVKYGIGVAITNLAFSGNLFYYILGIAVFIVFVVATRFLFFKPFESWASRYLEPQQKKVQQHAMWRARVLSRISLKVPSMHITGRRRHHATREAGQTLPRKWNIRPYYILAAIVLVLVLAYVIETHVYLIGYEVMVLESLAASFLRVWLAFLVTLVVSVPICVYLVFMSKRSNSYITLFQILASIPATILLPAIAVSLSKYPHSGEITAFIIFFISGIWYMIFGMLASARTLTPEVFEVKKTFGVKGLQAWRRIYIGALLPGMITGGITAIAGEWNASIVAEYFTTSGISGTNVVSSVGLGIGKLLDLSLAHGNLILLVTALINLTAMIIIINTFVWKKLYRKAASTWG